MNMDDDLIPSRDELFPLEELAIDLADVRLAQAPRFSEARLCWDFCIVHRGEVHYVPSLGWTTWQQWRWHPDPESLSVKALILQICVQAASDVESEERT